MPKRTEGKRLTKAQRTVCWFSCGAASAVAAALTPESVVAYCDTGAEHPDNARFMADCEKWIGRSVEVLRSKDYHDTWSVWEKRRFIAGINGAPCTTELKIAPRLAFQRPSDIHVFGYTADRSDVERAARLRDNYPELTILTPLIERGIDKAACLAMLHGAGIQPPITYALGFPNANCLPCGKATSPNYWALVRKEFPERFSRMAALSRSLGARLARVNGARVYIDEIPADWPTTDPIAPACDFLCALAEGDLPAALKTGASE